MLNSIGSGEHIDAADAYSSITGLYEYLQVAGEGGGLAADVYDLVNAVADDFRQCLGMDSIAGRIENDEVRLFFDVVQYLQDITGEEAAVFQSVSGGVQSGCSPRPLLQSPHQ